MSTLLTPMTPALPMGPPTLPKAIGDDVTTVVPAHHAAVTPDSYRFTLAQYLKMGEAEILTKADRVELIEGIVERKPVENPPHADALVELLAFMMRFHGESWTIRTQNQVNLDNSAAEPDIAILRGHRNQYRARHAVPADIAFVIEAAHASLGRDSTTKLGMYARNGIPVYWIVNIPAARIEVYSVPVGEAYQERTDYVAGQSVPVVLDGVTVAEFPVSDIFGEPAPLETV